LKTYTYRQAGVDVKKGDEFASYIKERVSVPDWLIKEPTGYASILSFVNPPIVVTADGIGTKILLHTKYERFRDAAMDLVAMNYNDIVAVGGRPLAFLDYLGVSDIGGFLKNFIETLAGVLEEVDMYLVAGETAEMPDIYDKGHWDAAGFAIGIWEKKLPIDDIQIGDVIMGIPSSGFHSNGWSLIRKIIDEENIDIEKLLFDLLAGTRIYKEAIQLFPYVKAIAHVTGGGIKRALRRVLKDKGYRIGLPQRDFINWILGYVDFEEALNTFNMGIGLIVVVSPENIDHVLRVYEDALIIGKVSPFIEVKYGL